MELVELVKAARAGDKDAFGAIVRRFQDMAYGEAYSWLGVPEDARDAAQDAFIDAWESLGQLRDEAAFPGWFRRIVRKHADRHKRRRRHEVVLDEWGTAVEVPDTFRLTEQEELRWAVRAAVDRLPEIYRLPLALFHLEELPQKEVAAFLELPVSTVKKRIFDARKLLERRLSHMARQEFAGARPSKDEGFARRVDFFVALREGDVEAVSRLLDVEPSLLSLRKSYEFSSDEVIPQNLDAAAWAALTNNVELLKLVLDRGVPVEPTQGESLLHSAVMAGAHEAMRLLLTRGADVGRRDLCGQTPLHRAVMRNDSVAVDLLLEAGAQLDEADHRGRTAADWATLKGRGELLDSLVARGARRPQFPMLTSRLRKPAGPDRKVMVGEGTLGHFLDAQGIPISGSPHAESKRIPASIDQPLSPILETGIKAIDLFSPLRRGGVNALSAGKGVGAGIVIPQIARNLATEVDARIIFVAAQTLNPSLLFREWRSMLTDGGFLGERTTYVLARPGDPGSCKEAAETGFATADAFRSEGHEVLLLIDKRIAAMAEVKRFLRLCGSTTPQAAVTTLCLGSVPDQGAANGFDAVIRLDGNRARDGLYPAVSPVQSASHLLLDDLLDADHRQEVARARELLRRYYEHAQQPQKEIARPVPRSGSLWHTDAATEDEEETWRLMVRGRRLDLFLTQSFHGTELWIGEPGEVVPLAEALDGCRRIVAGELDEVPEKAFYMVGTLQQVAEKAGRL